ncbi:MAG: hypothetical protein LAP21_09435 [Acidobacteriia bacterium]|nr:hypothetical protein [Terriglobia bacterium]
MASGAQTLQSGAGAVVDGVNQGMGPKPPDANDSQYRMGIGQRILGMANNFLQGMAHRNPVSYTGRGATNGQYGRDMEAYRNGTLGSPSQKPLTSAGNAGGGPVQKTPPTLWDLDKKIIRSPSERNGSGPTQGLA